MRTLSGRTLLVAASAAILASIVAGIAVIGSPATERLEQLDAARVRDLQGVMAATDLYWARNDRLPEALSELERDPRSFVSTNDPVTAEPYGYRTLGPETYELCATFDRASAAALPGPDPEFWRHGAGRQCFALRVDPTVARP